MKSLIIPFLGLVLVLGSCKEKMETKKLEVEQSDAAITIEKPISPILKELSEFAALETTDTIGVDQLFLFKAIDENGAVVTVDANRAIDLYKKMMKREAVKSWPIFEIENTGDAVLLVQGIGFGGPIWAKVLVDKNTLKIKKIEFEHKAESDGYGAAMTQSAFEDKFVGTKIDLVKNSFTLQKNIEKRRDDGTIVDGISGATMTSKSAVEMVNYGLQKYRGYLAQN